MPAVFALRLCRRSRSTTQCQILPNGNAKEGRCRQKLEMIIGGKRRKHSCKGKDREPDNVRNRELVRRGQLYPDVASQKKRRASEYRQSGLHRAFIFGMGQ